MKQFLRFSVHFFQNAQCKICLNSKVVGVSRESLLKSDLSKARKSCKFRILTEDQKVRIDIADFDSLKQC